MLAAKAAPVEERTITAREAAQYLGIPAGTIRAWASQGLLYSATAIGADGDEFFDVRGQKEYKLSDVLELASTKTRRLASHTRPNRVGGRAAPVS